MGGREHVGGTARRGVGRVLALILVLFLLGAVWATATRAGATRSHTTRAARIRRGPTTVPRSVPPIIPTATPIAPSSAAPPRPAARPRGANPAGPSTFWTIAAPDGSQFTVEKYDAAGTGPQPTVVMLPGTAGWTVGDERHAAILAQQGFTAVTLCWFRDQHDAKGVIACPDAPAYVGVSWSTLSNLSALIAGIKHLPGVDPARVAVAGFSRGGGEALLHATLGGPEPVVSVSALIAPETFVTLPSETNVDTFAEGIRAPTFIAYGVDDKFVNPFANSIAIAEAIRVAGRAPEPTVRSYRGGHSIDLIGDPVRGTAIDAARVLADEVAFLRSNLTVARTVTAPPTGGYYTLYGDGRVLARDGAPWFGNPSWPGLDIARDLAVMPDGNGYVVLDEFGGLHGFGSARDLPLASAPEFGADVARAVAITPSGNGLVVLDAWGGLHPAGDAPLLRATTYWPGWDIARDIAITADGAGYLVLDGLGGVHKLGTATRLDGSLPYRGTDVAQRLVVSPTGAGFGVLDRDGTLSLTGDIRPPAQAATTEDDWVGAAPTATGWVVVGRDRREVNWGWRSR